MSSDIAKSRRHNNRDNTVFKEMYILFSLSLLRSLATLHSESTRLSLIVDLIICVSGTEASRNILKDGMGGVFTYPCKSSTTDTAVEASSPVVGSSRNKTDGDIISSIPILVRLRSPPEMPRMNSFPTCNNYHYSKKETNAHITGG